MIHEQVFLGGAPIVGFGESATTPVVTPSTSPWAFMLASSVVSTAAGWALDEVVRRIRGGKR